MCVVCYRLRIRLLYKSCSSTLNHMLGRVFHLFSPRIHSLGCFAGTWAEAHQQLKTCMGDSEPQPISRQYGYIHPGFELTARLCIAIPCIVVRWWRASSNSTSYMCFHNALVIEWLHPPMMVAYHFSIQDVRCIGYQAHHILYDTHTLDDRRSYTRLSISISCRPFDWSGFTELDGHAILVGSMQIELISRNVE